MKRKSITIRELWDIGDELGEKNFDSRRNKSEKLIYSQAFYDLMAKIDPPDQNSGVDTLGDRFTNICLEVIREKPDNIYQAWINVGDRLGYEFIAALMRNMEWHSPLKEFDDQEHCS